MRQRVYAPGAGHAPRVCASNACARHFLYIYKEKPSKTLTNVRRGGPSSFHHFWCLLKAYAPEICANRPLMEIKKKRLAKNAPVFDICARTMRLHVNFAECSTDPNQRDMRHKSMRLEQRQNFLLAD